MPRTIASRSMSLLTESEAQLVLASAPRNVTELTPRALKGKTQRARRLVGKYQDQARRQRREAIGKRVPSRGRKAEHNMNTVRKAALIQNALERFEKRLELLERKAERAAAIKSKAAVHRTPRRTATSTAKRRAKGHAPGEAKPSGRISATTRKASGRVVASTTKVSRSGTGKVRAAAATKKGGALKKKRAVGIGRAAHAGSLGRRKQGKRDDVRA